MRWGLIVSFCLVAVVQWSAGRIVWLMLFWFYACTVTQNSCCWVEPGPCQWAKADDWTEFPCRMLVAFGGWMIRKSKRWEDPTKWSHLFSCVSLKSVINEQSLTRCCWNASWLRILGHYGISLEEWCSHFLLECSHKPICEIIVKYY